MFDVYNQNVEEVLAQIAELTKRGAPIPRELQDRLDAAGAEPDASGGFFGGEKKPKKSGPPSFSDMMDYYMGGEDPRIKQNQAIRDFVKHVPNVNINDTVKLPNVDTRGFGDWSPDTRGWGKEGLPGGDNWAEQWAKDHPTAAGMAYPTDKYREVIKRANPYSPAANKELQRRDDPRRVMSVEELDQKLEDQATRRREQRDRLMGEGPVSVTSGPVDTNPNAPSGKLIPGLREDVGTGAGPLMSAHESIPESIRQLVQEGMGGPNVAQGVRPDVAQGVAPASPQAGMATANERPTVGPPQDMGAIPGLEAYEPTGPPEPWRVGESSPGFLDKEGGLFSKFVDATQKFSPSTAAGQGLMAAAFSMLQGAPGGYGNFGAAIGHGGARGLQAYSAAHEQEMQDKWKQMALDQQRALADRKDTLEWTKAQLQYGGKVPEQVKEAMDKIVKMNEYDPAGAQDAYQNNASLKVYYPGWKGGHKETPDDILVQGLRGNPRLLSQYLEAKSKGTTQSYMQQLGEEILNSYQGDPEKRREFFEYVISHGGGAATNQALSNDPDYIAVSAPERMAGYQQNLPRLPKPTVKGEVGESDPAMQAAEEATGKWAQENGITDRDQIIKHMQEVYTQLKQRK